MIPPKEKAKELFWQYLPILGSWKEENLDKAKQCALIAVDEILDNFGSRVGDKIHYCTYLTIHYYEEVKQEIEKL